LLNFQYDVAVLVKALPYWVDIQSATFDNAVEVDLMQGPVQIPSGKTLNITFSTAMDSLDPGLYQVTVAFGVLDGEQYPG
jgi:hypothetical protein